MSENAARNQYKWELIALNAIEHAAQSNWVLALAANEAANNGRPVDPGKLLAFVRENQARLQRDLRDLRKITEQREKEEHEKEDQ